ncbi:hypothetical protein OROMI_033273 [Orobanche minor]
MSEQPKYAYPYPAPQQPQDGTRDFNTYDFAVCGNRLLPRTECNGTASVCCSSSSKEATWVLGGMPSSLVLLLRSGRMLRNIFLFLGSPDFYALIWFDLDLDLDLLIFCSI